MKLIGGQEALAIRENDIIKNIIINDNINQKRKHIFK